MIALGIGGDLDVALPLDEHGAARRHLSRHPDLVRGQGRVAIGGEDAIGAIGVAHIGNVDDEADFALPAGDALHAAEAVNQIALGVAIHVLEEVAGFIGAGRTALRVQPGTSAQDGAGAGGSSAQASAASASAIHTLNNGTAPARGAAAPEP